MSFGDRCRRFPPLFTVARASTLCQDQLQSTSLKGINTVYWVSLVVANRCMALGPARYNISPWRMLWIEKRPRRLILMRMAELAVMSSCTRVVIRQSVSTSTGNIFRRREEKSQTRSAVALYRFQNGIINIAHVKLNFMTFGPFHCISFSITSDEER